MMKTFEIMQRSKREKFRYTIIPTMFDKRTCASLMTLQSIKEQYGEAVWNAVIPIDTKFRDASLVHIPPSIYAPGSRAPMPMRPCSTISTRWSVNGPRR